MTGTGRRAFALCLCVQAAGLALSRSPRADELSGADKLRVLYSPQFAFTRDGLPLVTVRLSEGQKEIRVRAAAPVRVMPDGEMGAELRGGQEWTVRLAGPGHKAEHRFHVVVGRAPPQEAERLHEEGRLWRERGFTPRTFEIGAVFGTRGEVIDARQLLLTVAPHDDEAAARKEGQALRERFHSDPGPGPGIYSELITRPRGVIEARDERGTTIRNDGVLWFAPGEADPPAGGTLRVDPPGRSYFGQIYVTTDRHGTLAVVNAVPEDRLLAGLVPAEMSASSPLEALKAQAVAARNQLLAKLGARHMGDPYRLCAAQHCQVYAGAGQEAPRATQAVLATRGELLCTGPAGAEVLVDTVYSASCGGHTEDNDQAWGTRADPILRGHLDLPEGEQRRLSRFAGRIGDAEVAAFLVPDLSPRPLCGRPPGKSAQASFRWSTRISAETILGQLGPGPGIGSLREVTALARGASGRVVALRVVGTTGEREVRTELEVRRVLGGLKSALFTLSPLYQGQALVALDVTGGGHGHGVGMCQYGAVALGEAGSTYRQILEHYYPGARLRRLY